MVLLRGHVQTIFGKINVIMTLRGESTEHLYQLVPVAAIMPIILHGSFYCGVDPLPDAKDSSLHRLDGTVREGV